MISKRFFLAGMAATAVATGVKAAPALSSMSTGAVAITVAERLARIARLQGLMQVQGIGALVVESGPTLDYFTGIQWWRSERVTAAILPAQGDAIIITPAFEEPSVRESLAIAAEVRPWNEDEDPTVYLARGLADRKLAKGKVAFEETTRLFIVDGVRRANSDLQIVSGSALVRACRQIKSPAELALMQVANDITLAALRYVHGQVTAGMATHDIADLMDKTTGQLGGPSEFSLVLLNEASAYPHGSKQAQTVRNGSVILMDCGCSVHGYQSDMSRSWVFGTPTPKQRKVWETVRRGQDVALETARIGVPVGTIDDAVRVFYEKEGWGPGYHLPGLPHRTGHGIGMEGHESPYLVHGDATPLQAGMCFSDEPGLYIPGEFGIRLEDCWHMTEGGPKLFSPLAKSFDDPV